MEWIQRQPAQKYLESSEYIDVEHPKVAIIARYCMERALHAAETGDKDVCLDPEAEVARQAYLLVRDEIAHSRDKRVSGGAGRLKSLKEKVPFKASDVLSSKEGLCFAKANLLCAILRACGIPAGIGYQYLKENSEDPDSKLILHALNFIYLEAAGGWFRVDARGNRDKLVDEDGNVLDGGVNAFFDLEGQGSKESLAFEADYNLGECDLPFIFASHDKIVVAKYTRYCEDFNGLWNDLPDKLSGNE